MFAGAYFAPRFFAPRYFPEGPAVALSEAPYFYHGHFPSRYFAQHYFPGTLPTGTTPPTPPPTTTITGLVPQPRPRPRIDGYGDLEAPRPDIFGRGRIDPARFRIQGILAAPSATVIGTLHLQPAAISGTASTAFDLPGSSARGTVQPPESRQTDTATDADIEAMLMAHYLSARRKS